MGTAPLRTSTETGTKAGTQTDAERVYARDVIRAEADALRDLAETIDGGFEAAVDIIVRCAEADGLVIVSGLGKSGLIGAKISATLASLGIPSHAVHPSEATHGDLGRVRTRDVLIALSKSGETDEVVSLAAILRQDGLGIIALTSAGGDASSLGRLATVSLAVGGTEEAGGSPAPTASTTCTLAMGDALALAAARRRRFTDADFAKRHPGGSLGGLLKPVVEALRFKLGENLPLVRDEHTVADALRDAAQQSDRRPGALLLVDADGALSGIFTDGDLRRLVLNNPAALDQPIAAVMTRSPRTLRDDALLRDAVAMIREHRQDEIPVVDADGKPVGLLDVQDLITLKLVRD